MAKGIKACYTGKTGDFAEVCRDMNIISNLPDKFFPYTQIDVVQFPSGLGGNDRLLIE